MENPDRRALMGAATVVGLAALAARTPRASAGPIDPPATPVGPTGHTLDEIYNKIAADGRTPIPGGSPVFINQPGSYGLTGNITSGGTVVTINVSDVTLDLNGFTLTNTSSALTVISVPNTVHNVVIRNGSLFGGQYVIQTSVLTNSLFEDLNIQSGKLAGIIVAAAASRSIVVRRCSIIDTGASTTAADTAQVSALSLAGGNHRVEDCSIARVMTNGTTTALRGIIFSTTAASGAQGNLVARCTVSHETSATATGIVFAGNGVYRDNTVMNFTTPYSGGTNGNGNI